MGQCRLGEMLVQHRRDHQSARHEQTCLTPSGPHNMQKAERLLQQAAALLRKA